jgi:hypothetical protein
MQRFNEEPSQNVSSLCVALSLQILRRGIDTSVPPSAGWFQKSLAVCLAEVKQDSPAKVIPLNEVPL